MKKSSQPKKCPYLNSKDCGRPNKDPMKFCESYKSCISYKFLKELEERKDEDKDGKEDC